MNDDTTVTISIEGDIDMKIGDLWPDGDAPDPVTAADVVALMEDAGRKEWVLRDWCLIDDLAVQVIVDRPNPAWSQDEVLFGDPAPRWLHENAEVW